MKTKLTPAALIGDRVSHWIWSCYNLDISSKTKTGGTPLLAFDYYYDPGCGGSFDERRDHLHYYQIPWHKFLKIVSALTPGQKISLDTSLTVEILDDDATLQFTIDGHTFKRTIK